MTFTYDLSATTGDNADLTFIRFHLGDVDEDLEIFSDEELLFIRNSSRLGAGDVNTTVVIALRGLIARLSGDPDFTADWLTVDVDKAVARFRKLLTDKLNEFNLGQFTATPAYVYRVDSDQTADPDYAATGDSGWMSNRESGSEWA